MFYQDNRDLGGSVSKKSIIRASALLCLFAGAVTAQASLAQSSYLGSSYTIAQVDPDESYDPFSDYSEFDEESDEEADINFFRNGRFLTAGLVAGMRGFTGNMADTYGSGPTFGLFLSYFFDLRLALNIGFQTGDHGVQFTTNNSTREYVGNVSMSSINFDLKYFINTQNISRGLADLNPYIIGGIGQFYRTYTIAGFDEYGRDSAMGFDFGAGIEIPLMKKKAFLGVQLTYHYINFGDENKSFISAAGGSERLDRNIAGDPYDLLAIIGMNF